MTKTYATYAQPAADSHKLPDAERRFRFWGSAFDHLRMLKEKDDIRMFAVVSINDMKNRREIVYYPISELDKVQDDGEETMGRIRNFYVWVHDSPTPTDTEDQRPQRMATICWGEQFENIREILAMTP